MHNETLQYDIQLDDALLNDAQHDDIHRNDMQHNDTQQNEIQHNLHPAECNTNFRINFYCHAGCQYAECRVTISSDFL